MYCHTCDNVAQSACASSVGADEVAFDRVADGAAAPMPIPTILSADHTVGYRIVAGADSDAHAIIGEMENLKAIDQIIVRLDREAVSTTQTAAVQDDTGIAAVDGKVALRDVGQRPTAEGDGGWAVRREDGWVKGDGVAVGGIQHGLA